MTLRSRWLVFLGLDEVALFGAEQTGAVVNAEEILRAGESRLVPGGCTWVVSSPFGPSGLLFELWKAHFGAPDGRVLVVHAPTRALNPAFSAAQVEAIRRRDPDAAAREYDAIWLDADTAFLDAATIARAVRPAPLELSRTSTGRYVAAMDPATRGNAWSLIVAHVERARGEPGSEGATTARIAVAVARQWVGSRSAPLDPGSTLGDIAAVLRRFGVREVLSDQWSLDSLASIARVHRLSLRERSASAAQEGYATMRTLLATGCLELAPEPALLQDLRGLRKKALAGGVRIELPRTADGRHCDYAPALALCVNEARTVSDGGDDMMASNALLARLQAPSRMVHATEGSDDWDEDDDEGAIARAIAAMAAAQEQRTTEGGS